MHAERPIEPVIVDVELPAGVLGPEPVSFDVRCFLIPHGTGVALVDTGPPGSGELIAAGLTALKAAWCDVTDIVLTHAHFDHVGSLDEILDRCSSAVIWAGADDMPEIRSRGRGVSPLRDRNVVRGLRAIHTPGHTPGHTSLLQEDSSTLLLGDLAGTMSGRVTRPPTPFTADPPQSDRSLRGILELDVHRVLPSHGPELSRPRETLLNLLAEPLAGR